MSQEYGQNPPTCHGRRTLLHEMRGLFVLVVIILIVAVALAVVGPSMPAGSPWRAAGDGLRGIGDFLARGFGGGYGEIAPGG